MLLHGVGTGPETWRPQVAALGGEVVTPALRLDAEFSIEHAASRIWAELSEREVDIGGLSLGALVALRMTLDRPERVRRLVLCAGFAALARRHRALQAVIGTVASLVPRRMRRELGDMDGGGIRAVFRAGRRFDVTNELGRLTMPVLVLVGERDRVNANLSGRLAAALPEAQLQIVAGAGHLANEDAPDDFTALLRAFLS